MNTLHERLGVAVEADSARYSGELFASARGTSIAGRVRRRRAVRATGYGGGAMLAVGALAVGGARLPWATLSGGLNVGAGDCVTASPSGATGTGPSAAAAPEPMSAHSATLEIKSDEQGLVTVHHLDSDEQFTIDARDGAFEFIGDHGVLATLAGDEDMATVTFLSGEVYDVVVEREGDALASVAVTPHGGGEVVGIVWEANGDVLGPVKFDDGTGSAAPQPPAASLSPSPSVDCVTPSPSSGHTATPAPSPSPESSQESVVNPFVIGTVLPTEEQGSDDLFVATVEWLTPEQVNSQLSANDQDSPDAPRAMGSDPVPQVTIIDRMGGLTDTDLAGGVGGPLDPEVLIERGVGTYSNPGAIFVQGASFVAVQDGVVVGVVEFREDWNPYQPVMLEPSGELGLDILATFLNPDGAFFDASGVPVAGDYDIYVVAGAGVFDESGNYSGSAYAWKKLDKPE